MVGPAGNMAEEAQENEAVAEPAKPERQAVDPVMPDPAKLEPARLALPALPVDMPLLRIEGVVKKFGSFRAVDGVSLDIRAGEFFALLGPSGCGKTTLLRMLAGFETPDQGRILLSGREIGRAHV